MNHNLPRMKRMKRLLPLAAFTLGLLTAGSPGETVNLYAGPDGPDGRKERRVQADTMAWTDKKRQKRMNMKAEEDKISMSVNGQTFTVTLVRNSSTESLLERLAQGDLTVYMEDYARMEKVGDLGTRLPRNDRMLTASPGDLILYQGRYLVIYYDRNTYSLTSLGRIDQVSQQELKEVLGTGAVTVTLSLP